MFACHVTCVFFFVPTFPPLVSDQVIFSSWPSGHSARARSSDLDLGVTNQVTGFVGVSQLVTGFYPIFFSTMVCNLKQFHETSSDIIQCFCHGFIKLFRPLLDLAVTPRPKIDPFALTNCLPHVQMNK